MDQEYQKVLTVKREHQEALLALPNVVGVGIGCAIRGGVTTEVLSLVVLVDHKIAAESLSESERVPTEIEGVPVDVVEVGAVRAHRDG